MNQFKKELVELSDFAYARLRDRLEGLTDDEYFWEPAPDSWTIHQNGDGAFRGDWGFIFDEVPPVTTIAWRIGHIIDCLCGHRGLRWLGVQPTDSPTKDGLPGTADAARDALDRAHAIWRSYVLAADDSNLLDRLGEIAAPYQDSSRAGFVLHILDELIHHGAEVALLRDLYRAAAADEPFVVACLKGDRTTIDAMRASEDGIVDRTIAEHPDLMLRAAATGRFDAIPLLLELGFPVNGTTGRGPVHHAAGMAKLDTIRLLVEHGADLDANDPIYNSTPVEWAEYFNEKEAADLLRSLA